MKMIKLLLVCFIILSFTTSVMADKTLFDCSIIRNKTLSPDGLVVTSFDDLKTELENKKLNGDLDSMVTKYPSASETDRQVFKGQFKCKDSQLVIAVLSDDGVNVKVTNTDTGIQTNVASYEQGQALPNLDSSLKLINGSWTDDTTYNVEIDYSNICYTGNGDIDGLTLYFCGDVEFIPNQDPIVPDAGISISFPKSIYNVGESTEANVVIYGKTNSANIMATVTGLGISQTIVDVSSGYGAATVNIPTYSSPNTYVYTATVTINGITVSNTTFINVISNTAPIVTNATTIIDEDTPSNPITLTATDPDGDTLTYSIDNPYTYTPPQDFNGVDIVTFTVDDGRGGISTGTVTVTVNPINDAPVAYDGYFDTDEDSETTIYYPGYDVDGDTVMPAIIDGPTHGTLGNYDSLTNSVSYTPAANYNGTDTIKFLLNDGISDSNEATISINVIPVGDNISIATGKYLYANGVDSCNVSIVGSPNTVVTLSTTGGTLSNTALTTDDQGQVSVTLTSSIIPGEVTVTASMLGDDALAKVTFFTFDLQVANCISVPNSVIFATSIGKTGEKVNVNVATTPVIDLSDTSLGFTFAGGVEGTTIDYHTVVKDVADVTTVTASMRSVSKTCDVAVIKVTEIVADSTIISVFVDNTYVLNEKQAVTSWTETPDSVAVLKVNVIPDIAAIHEIYNKLFVWSGGQAGDTIDKRIISRNAPNKTKISIKCGESSDAVVAWVAKVNINIADIDDSIEDTPTGIATIYPNTDDDDNTAATDYDGSDLCESPVIGENDLVPISLSVEPAGIGGKFMLNTDSALKLNVYRYADKSGTVSSTFSWMIPTDPNSTEIMPQLLYLEGQEVSNDDGDQIIKAEYYWGEYKLDLYCDDTVKATVKPREGDSEVSICVFNPAKNSQGVNIPGVEKYSPIGGKMYVGLKIKIGTGERLATTLQSMTVKIQDDYNYDGDPAFTRHTFDLTTAANWFELINAGTPFQEWEPAIIAPNDLNGNKNGSSARIFCRIFEWDTSFTPSLNFTPPMGHNGAHTLEVVKINGLDGNKALFQRYNNGWQTAYEIEVPAQKAVVKNLVVTNVSTSNGTEDYFKYDPVSGSLYNRPVINFTIEDEGDPHEYDAVILMWPTSITADVFTRLTTSDAVAWTENTHLNTGNVNITWDGSLVPLNYAGHEADQADWSTYAFEICVYEYPDNNSKVADFTDWFYLRWPYCNYISNDPVDGHKVWDTTTDNGEKELRCFYKLSDHNNADSESITLIPLNEIMTEVANINGGTGVCINYGGTDGMIVARDSNMDGVWRVMFTGVDSCWKGYRRDHNNSRMLAINAKSKDAVYYLDYIKMVAKLEKMKATFRYGDPEISVGPTDIDKSLNNNIDGACLTLRTIRYLQNDYCDNNSYLDSNIALWEKFAGIIPVGVVYSDPIIKDNVVNFFKNHKKIMVPKVGGNYEIIDASHFNASLNSMVYNAGLLMNQVISYSEDQINEVTSWAGDLQTGLVDLVKFVKYRKENNNYNDSDLYSYAKRIIGAKEEMIELYSIKQVVTDGVILPLTKKIPTMGTCPYTDLIEDIDAYNIGTYYKRSFDSGGRLSIIMKNYYLYDSKYRFSKFMNIYGQNLYRDVDFMLQKDSHGCDHLLILKTALNLKNEPITEIERNCIRMAFLSFLNNNKNKE